MTTAWRCTVCDFVSQGTALPERCPGCDAGPEFALPCRLPAARTPAVAAHRGASAEAPENTPAAFRLAWEEGADFVEADIRLTRDQRLVCVHDADTARVAAERLVVEEATLDELRALDVGLWKGASWRGAQAPTFEELAATVPTGKGLLLDVKNCPGIVALLADALTACPLLPSRVALVSFHEELLEEARRALPHHRRLLLLDTGSDTPPGQALVDRVDRVGAHGVDLRLQPWMSPALAAPLREAGREVHLWTVDTAEEVVQALTLDPDSITTNRPGWLVEQLKAS
jgi:glycerophosphoryl diester phosphodiesterase